MNSISSHDEDADKGFPRLEPSPEDRFVSLYLEDRSDVYRDLIKVQDDVSNTKSFHGLALFVNLPSRHGTIPKLLPTSAGNAARPTIRQRGNSGFSTT